MQAIMEKRAAELLTDGTVNRVLGWAAGEFPYDMTPAVFHSVKELEDGFVYNDFCGANLSKYLIKESKKEVIAKKYIKQKTLNKPLRKWAKK